MEKLRLSNVQRLLLTHIGGLEAAMPRMENVGINIPDDVEITDNELQLATAAVEQYNSRATRSVERNGSILNPDSVHNLWHSLLKLTIGEHHRPKEQGRRVVYEWLLVHSTKKTMQALDFTFIPSSLSHLNWGQYCGGLELNVTPACGQKGASIDKSVKKSGAASSTSGPVMNAGRRQALSRAAMCILARCENTEWKEAQRAFCCFADSRMLGVAIISFSFEDGPALTVMTHGPYFLPGYQQSQDKFALRLLKFVLSSPVERLSDLMSPPLPVCSLFINGLITQGNVASEARWTMGPLLGAGGFAVVSAWGEQEAQRCTVIKTLAMADETSSGLYANKLTRELEILNKLQENMSMHHFFPRCLAHLVDPHSDDMRVVALQLHPRGIPVPKYLRLLGTSSKILDPLLQSLGPAMVEALRLSHSIGICHQDVRPPNLLIVPPLTLMLSLAGEGVDLFDELKIFRDVSNELARSSSPAESNREIFYVLNDWGEATCSAGNNDKGKKRDLSSLVLALANLEDFVDATSMTQSSMQPIFDKFPSAQYLRPTEAQELFTLANEQRYDELKRKLSSITSVHVPSAINESNVEET